MNRLVLQFTAHLHINRYSESSIQNHRLDLLKYKDWLEGQGDASLDRLRAFTRADVALYQDFLAQRLKQRSINRHLSTLRLFFRFLEDSGLIEVSPLDAMQFPKFLPELPTMLLPGEVTALLEAPPESHYLGLRDRAMLELLYSSGVKLNELIALDVEHLNLELSFVRVGGRRERMVPLTDKAVELLVRYLEECRPGRVLHAGETCLFPGRNGTRISRVGVWKLVKKHAQAAGIEKNFNPRGLRHAFAIHLLLGGADLDTIKFLFGYRRLEATALYAHVNAPDVQAAYRAYHPQAQDAPAASAPQPEGA